MGRSSVDFELLFKGLPQAKEYETASSSRIYEQVVATKNYPSSEKLANSIVEKLTDNLKTSIELNIEYQEVKENLNRVSHKENQTSNVNSTQSIHTAPVLPEYRNLYATYVNQNFDQLPKYTCNLERSGYLYLKKELGKNGVKSYKRQWSLNYFVLQGTSLKIYESNPSTRHITSKPLESLANWNLAKLSVVEATYYFKHPFTFRILHDNGASHLIRSKEQRISAGWMRDLASSVILALDIDLRPVVPS